MLSQADKKHKALNGHSEDSLGSHQSSKTLRFFGDSDKESLSKSSRIASPRLKDSSPTRHLLQVFKGWSLRNACYVNSIHRRFIFVQKGR